MIVFCHLLNDHSGSPKVLRSTIKAFESKYAGMLFVGSQGRGVLEQAGAATKRYWYHRSRYRLITLFSYIISQFALYAALSREKKIPANAIVYVNTLLPFGAMLWGRRTGRRVIVHVHEVSIAPWLLRFLLTRLAAFAADLLIYVTHDHRARLPMPGKRSVIIHNPVENIHSENITKRLVRKNGEFHVLMLASFKAYKGIEEFSQLAKSLKYRTDIRFSLVLNAEGQAVQQFCEEKKDISNLTIFPRTERPEIHYQTADVVMNLSRVDQWIETFGLTLVEAMAFGIPVIAPPIGGPSEIISDEIEGYLVDSRDGDLLKVKLLYLVDNPSIHAQMSSDARRRAEQFSFEAYSNNLHKMLEEFLKENIK